MMQQQNERLLSMLAECAAVCNNCARACLEEQDVQKLSKCILLDLDCADICAISHRLLSRGSAHAEHLLRECHEICQACADECSKHNHMDHCRECADICRACAEACTEAAM